MMLALDMFSMAVDMCIGAALLLVGIALGFWLAFLERKNYGKDRFEAGIASGIARERNANFDRIQRGIPQWTLWQIGHAVFGWAMPW